jgi:hypothetical protein
VFKRAQTTRRHIPEDSKFHTHRSENFKSYKLTLPQHFSKLCFLVFFHRLNFNYISLFTVDLSVLYILHALCGVKLDNVVNNKLRNVYNDNYQSDQSMSRQPQVHETVLIHTVQTSYETHPALYPLGTGHLFAVYTTRPDARLRIRGATPPLSNNIFMAWCGDITLTFDL